MDGEGIAVSVPKEFFSDILPRIRDLAELKVILHVMQEASRRSRPAVSLRHLLAPEVLRSVVGLESPEPAEERLRRTVDRAVADGFLLRISVEGDHRLLTTSADNLTLLDRLRDGASDAASEVGVEPTDAVGIYRPNVFSVYERHIGALTPLVAERLRDAERSYPRAWVEEAIRLADHYNKRNWSYIQAILTRWEETGGPQGE